MTYAPTVNYLREQALAAGAASFWHGKQQTQSINYNASFPQAHLFLLPAPLIGQLVAYEVRMAFYGPDELEGDGETALPIQDDMDRLSQAFVDRLREDARFDVSERIDRAPLLREGAQVGTGFFISFTLTGPALC